MPEELAPQPGFEGPRAPGFGTLLSDRALRIIVVCAFVIMLGLGIVLPVVPLFARGFGVGYRSVGILVGSYAVARLVIDPFAGPIVDRIGERRTSIAGLIVMAASSVATGLAPTFWFAVGFRSIGGAGSAVLFAALYSYLLKVVPKDRMARASGIFYGAFNLGVIAGGPLGGLIAGHLGVRAPMHVYAGVLLVAAGLYLRWVPDPPARAREAADPAPPEPVRVLLRRRVLLVTLYVNFVYLWFVGATFDTLIPLFAADRLGMAPAAIGAMFSIVVTTELVALYPSGQIADRTGRKPLLMASLIVLAAAVVLTGRASSIATFAVILAVMGIASGAAGVVPTAMLADVAPERRSGTAVGLFRFAGDVGLVAGPLVAGLVADRGGLGIAFVVAAAPSLLAVLLLVGTPETLQRARS